MYIYMKFTTIFIYFSKFYFLLYHLVDLANVQLIFLTI